MVETASDTLLHVSFPTAWKINKQYVQQLTLLNPALTFSWIAKNIAHIETADIPLTEMPYVELLLPHSITEEQLDKFIAHNERYKYHNDEINTVSFEWDGQNLIYIKMGTFAIFSAITAAIMTNLFFWVFENKKGRVYTGSGAYRLPNPTNLRIKTRIAPDISFISYEHVQEETQNLWVNSFIESPATLIIEIVSAKSGLKKEIAKMEDFWMCTGTHLGVIICPFSKKIYVFEPDKKYYTQSIYTPFTHPRLPGYTGDFSMYVDKIK